VAETGIWLILNEYLLQDPAFKTRSIFEFLARKTMTIIGANESTEGIDEEIRNFLSEDSIIARTKNCDQYFTDYLPSLATMAEVIFTCSSPSSSVVVHSTLNFEMQASIPAARR
jgi:hypothetical protein